MMYTVTCESTQQLVQALCFPQLLYTPVVGVVGVVDLFYVTSIECSLGGIIGWDMIFATEYNYAYLWKREQGSTQLSLEKNGQSS